MPQRLLYGREVPDPQRGIEQLKARRRASQNGGFTEAGFHSWFLSFGPLPPDAIAQTL